MPNATTCPETILAAIPWYPDGLSREECGAVEAHAADCRACRAELAFLLGEDEPAAIELADAEAVYTRVLERIARPDESEVEGGGRARLARTFSQRAVQPVSIAAGLMVALLSGMLTTGVIWTVRVAPTYEVYETASAAPVAAPVATPDGVALEVVFRPDATAQEVVTSLRAVGASVVSGPTPRGVYRVRLAPGVTAEPALDELRGSGVAIFAEPSRG